MRETQTVKSKGTQIFRIRFHQGSPSAVTKHRVGLCVLTGIGIAAVAALSKSNHPIHNTERANAANPVIALHQATWD